MVSAMRKLSLTESVSHVKHAEGIINVEWVNLLEQEKYEEVLSIVKTHSAEDLVDTAGNHIIYLAAKHNNVQLIKALLESECQFTAENSGGLTPFAIAVTHGNFEVAKALLDAHMDMMQETYSVISVFDWRSRIEGHLAKDFVSYMRKIKLSSERIGEALGKVIDCTAYDVVRFHDATMTKAYFQSITGLDDKTNLHRLFNMPAKKYDLQHIQVILRDAPCHRGRLYEQFMRYACPNICHLHRSRLGRKFLKGIFSLEVFDRETLEFLEQELKNFTINTLKAFLQYDFHTTVKVEFGVDILACVFGSNDPKITSFLRDEHIDVDGRSCDGKTPLHFAAESILIDNVRMLLDRGADPNALDDEQRTPLDLAVSACESKAVGKCVKLLLVAGADPLASDRFEKTLPRKYSIFVDVYQYVVAKLVVRETLGRSVERVRKLFRQWGILEIFVEKCQQQLDELSRYKIRDKKSSDVNFSMFTILVERSENLARYVSEDDVQVIHGFVERNGKTLTPYYRDLLKKRAEDIVLMRCYRNKVVQVVCEFTGIRDPHHLVVQKIVGYLNDRDFRKIAVRESQNARLKSKAQQWIRLTRQRVSRF